MAVDLSRPSVVPGCPPLQLKPSHFPVFQIPISLKNPSQSEVVRNWLSYPGAEAGCPSVPGARPLLPAQRPHTVGCLSSGHSRLLPWASFGFSTWYQPSLTPCPPPPAHAFCLPLAAKSKNSPGLRGYFPLPLPHPCSKLALPPPILQDCHSPPASVSTKPRGGFCVLLLLHETFQPHTTDGLLPARAMERGCGFIEAVHTRACSPLNFCVLLTPSSKALSCTEGSLPPPFDRKQCQLHHRKSFDANKGSGGDRSSSQRI